MLFISKTSFIWTYFYAKCSHLVSLISLRYQIYHPDGLYGLPKKFVWFFPVFHRYHFFCVTGPFGIISICQQSSSLLIVYIKQSFALDGIFSHKKEIINELLSLHIPISTQYFLEWKSFKKNMYFFATLVFPIIKVEMKKVKTELIRFKSLNFPKKKSLLSHDNKQFLIGSLNSLHIFSQLPN